jgi:lipopolysaccharide-induced tumor necrosis factor-alpha factor
MTEPRHQSNPKHSIQLYTIANQPPAPTHMCSEDPEAVYPTPSVPPAPGRMYSEDPEAVYPTPVVPPTPIHTMHTGASVSPSAKAKQYPYHPDSIGQAADYNAATGPHEKTYAGQPLNQQGPAHPHQYHTPYGPPSGYATAVPLHDVQSASCPVDCPVCGERGMTLIESVSGGTTR